MINVLIEYDDWLIAAGIAATLEQQGGFRVLRPDPVFSKLLSARCADVVIADYEAGLRLMRNGTSSAVLIFARYISEPQVRAALELGVAGYLLTGCTRGELLEGLRALSGGRKVFAAPVAEKLVESMRYPRLTGRELTVLSHVVRGRSDKDIGSQLAVSVGTVKTHMKSILSKLGARRRTEAAAIARRRGLFPEFE